MSKRNMLRPRLLQLLWTNAHENLSTSHTEHRTVVGKTRYSIGEMGFRAPSMWSLGWSKPSFS